MKEVRKALEILAFGFFINSTQSLFVEASDKANGLLACISSIIIVYCLWLDYRNSTKEQK